MLSADDNTAPIAQCDASISQQEHVVNSCEYNNRLGPIVTALTPVVLPAYRILTTKRTRIETVLIGYIIKNTLS